MADHMTDTVRRTSPMIPIALSRQEIEILLDSPSQRNYVVSAYADMTVQDGFRRYIDHALRNEARAVREALATAEARKELEANIETIREEVQTHYATSARGLAVFSSVARGLRRVIPLEFGVENHLVIDEEPFLLPLLEHWHGEPFFLIALLDSNEAHLFDLHHNRPVRVRDLEREDADEEIQRDKARFTYKKRFAATAHERLHGLEESPFLRQVAAAIEEQWRDGDFAGLLFLGRTQDISAVRKLLPRQIEERIVGEAAHAMTSQADDLTDDVSRLVGGWRARREKEILAELNERWKQNHLVANGATDVLDALQQGRATQLLLGRRWDIPGARCRSCGYRFGAPVAVCPYCQGPCQTVNATQDIMRLAMRHRIPVARLRGDGQNDPVEGAGGVVALLRAEANWAPNKDAARSSEGQANAV
jgi:peptide subunit release factor 1 (eRF1)